MQIDLLDLPNAVCLHRFGVIAFIHGQGNGVGDQPGGQLMLDVAVFAFQVGAHDDFRLVFADQAHHFHLRVYALLAPRFQGDAEAEHLLIPPVQENGMVAQARRPQAVQRFGIAAAPAVGHVHHGHVRAFLAGVGNGAAQEQQLVVLVGGEHHQIQLFRHRLPLLHGVIRIVGVINAQVPHPVFRPHKRQLHLPRAVGEHHGVRVKARGPGFLADGFLLFVQEFHRKGFHREAPRNGHELRGAVLGQGNGQDVAGLGRRPAAAGLGFLVRARRKLALIVDVAKRFELAAHVHRRAVNIHDFSVRRALDHQRFPSGGHG